MYFKILVAAFALSLAACSSTDTQSVSSAEVDNTGVNNEQTLAAADDQGIRCKRVQVTGTRMSEKVCTTAAQREESNRRASEAAAQIGIKAQQVGGLEGG